MDVLKRQLNRHPTRVFTYQGKPIGWANSRAWRQALTRAGIENFRWHGLRHTWSKRWGRGNRKAWFAATRISRLRTRQHAEGLTGVLNDTIAAQAGNEKGLAPS